MMTDDNGWTEHKREILYRLDELKEEMHEMRAEQQKQGRSIAGLTVRSSVWGGVSGALVILAEYTRRMFTGGV